MSKHRWCNTPDMGCSWYVMYSWCIQNEHCRHRCPAVMCRTGVLTVRSGSSTHLSASKSCTAAAPAPVDQLQRSEADRVSTTARAVDALASGAAAAASHAAAARQLAQIDDSSADSAGYLLHPAVGDNCIHIAAVPGESATVPCTLYRNGVNHAHRLNAQIH